MVRAGMSSLALAMRCSELSSSISSTIAKLNMFAWKCDRFAIGVHIPYCVTPASHAYHAEGRHLHVDGLALRQRHDLVVVAHEAVAVHHHVQRLVQRLRL